MSVLPRTNIVWSYFHYIFEDLYYISGIAGLIIVLITIIKYYKYKKDLLIQNSDKEYELSTEFDNLTKTWNDLFNQLKKNLEKTKINMIQTNNYQDILKDKKTNSKKYYIKKDDFSSANIQLDDIFSFIKGFDNFSRKYLNFVGKKDFIDRNKFLEIYSNIYSFSESIKHEQADKLFNKFSKLVTDEIKEIIPKE